jgi:hypothetical protein
VASRSLITFVIEGLGEQTRGSDLQKGEER